MRKLAAVALTVSLGLSCSQKQAYSLNDIHNAVVRRGVSNIGFYSDGRYFRAEYNSEERLLTLRSDGVLITSLGPEFGDGEYDYFGRAGEIAGIGKS